MRGQPVAQDELGRLFDEHSARLLGFLVYRTGDRALAEDVLADTFERAMTARRRPTGEGERAWLYTVALNRLRDLARRRDAEQRALEHCLPTAEDTGGAGFGIAEREVLHQALQRLPEQEREALALRYGADLTLKEIAAFTGERLTTVEGRVYRGLRRLREFLPDVDQVVDRSFV